MFTVYDKFVSVRVALVLALLVGVFGVLPVQATPSATFGWAKSMGGTSDDFGISIATDSSGNIYTTGYFQGTVDFDPGVGTSNLTSTGGYDIFISKLDNSGNFVWAKSMGGASGAFGLSITLDSSGNIYTTGHFDGTADFDPSAGISNLTGSGDVFVSKLDSNGNFVWAKSMGGMSSDIGRGIALDSSGNVYTTGYFSGTADFDPSAGTSNLTSAGSGDIFVSKLDSNGNFVWAKSMGGASDDDSWSITVGSSSNVYMTGYFQSTADFDPGAGISNLTSAGSYEIFISKLDSNGDFVWAKSMGGASGDSGFAITLDSSDNIYTTGYFRLTADFDPGIGVSNLTSAGGNDILISKLDSSGNFVWAKSMGGTSHDYGFAITLDSSGHIYTTGYFDDTADFDPGAGISNLTSAGSSDIFVSKLDTSGNFVWIKGMGGMSSDHGYGISLDSSGDVYTTGDFASVSDFDPSAGTTNLTSAGLADIFVTKLTVTPQIYYVKSNAGGLNNGSSWTNAYTDLQSALSAASSGDEIWVAAGTYKPTATTDRTISFTLNNGVTIYGGFAGTETLRTQRNPSTHITTLSGEIGVAGTADNSYHVVVGNGTNNTAVLDGFTITAGNANGASSYGSGGGMYNSGSNPSLTNMTFSTNSAIDGGGMANVSSSPNLTNVIFNSNSAEDGGGMFNSGGNPVLTNVLFSGNSASYIGGGLFNTTSNPSLTNVLFNSNSAVDIGGGMVNQINSSPNLENVTFYNNSAGNWGGGMANSNSSPSLINVTLNANTAISGGGIYNTVTSPIVKNSIVWGNTGGELANFNGSVPVVTYSIVQGGYVGTGNLEVDPLLGTLANNGGFTQTMALGAGSPAINSGTNTGCPATDQRGVTRPQGGQCDIGAYEYVMSSLTLTGKVGVGGATLSYVDGTLKTVTADGNGNYAITVPHGWSGTITPSKTGYLFAPAIRSYTNVTGDTVGQNYNLYNVSPADFNGDGQTDVAVFRPGNSTWYLSGQGATAFGQAGDIPVPADYNGDGKDDIAVFRPSNSTWYIQGQGSFGYGQAGDIPVVADYNGDGKDDIAVFRPGNSTWYIYGVGSFAYGTEGDIPVVADYNGDGQADIAVFRPTNSTWYLYGIGPRVYGTVGDVPVVADYNGDGQADIAVFRPTNSTWYIYGVGPRVYGTVGDIPVIGDYNGDGRADITVFRPSNSTWYKYGVGPSVYGTVGDIPV